MIRNHALGVRSNKVVLLLALFLGLIGAVLVYVFLSQAGGGEGGGASATTKPVVVAKEDIPAATRITASMVEVKPLSTDVVLPAAFTSTEGVVDKVARYPITAGEQVLSDKLVTSTLEVGEGAKTTPFSLTVPSGKRAVAVKVEQAIGAGGMILPGDSVDVIAVFPKMDDQVPVRSPTAMTVLQNVEVLAIDQNIGKVVVETADGATPGSGSESSAQRVVTDSEPNPEAVTATQAQTPQQTQNHTLAEGCADQGNGYLRLALRSFGEKETPSVQPLWLRDGGTADDCPSLLARGS
ncbi:MAG: Flp pilus assembly protein CpaB [Chloroflexota bacterium]|nr:Flp pilus assembly protein CpaB [Chloroflexota bacterium]